MDGCIYRTKDGECDLYADGGKYHAFCVGDAPCDGRKQSNADNIRQMSDEELAEFLAVCDASRFRIRSDTEAVTAEKYRWLDWLKEVESDA